MMRRRAQLWCWLLAAMAACSPGDDPAAAAARGDRGAGPGPNPAEQAPAAQAPAAQAPAAQDPAAQDPAAGDRAGADRWQRPPTDADTGLPSDFARFVTEGDGGHFDTAVTTYRDGDGTEVTLFAAVHIADAAHYEELQRRFAACDVLLYELVGPEDYRPSRDAPRSGLIAMLQTSLKNGLQLAFQLDGIDYSKANFVHADMTPEEMQESMAERGETLFGMLLKLSMQSQKAMYDNAGELAEVDTDLVSAFQRGEGRHTLRLMMASQLEQLEAVAAGAGDEGSTLLEGRNEKCLEVLQRELAAGRDRIGIYYGGAHMPHMERRLVEDLGFAKVEHEWLVAWDCALRKDPVVDRELWAQRRLAKKQLGELWAAVEAWGEANDGLRERAPGLDEVAYAGPRQDPWGQPYRITHYPRWPYVDVHSLGQDGLPGSDDDIHSASDFRLHRMKQALAAKAREDVEWDPEDMIANGRRLYLQLCSPCHRVDDQVLVGPPWSGLFRKNGEGEIVGTERQVIVDGKAETVIVDEAYITESIRTPQARRVAGAAFEHVHMVSFPDLPDDRIQAIIAYMKSLAR